MTPAPPRRSAEKPQKRALLLDALGTLLELQPPAPRLRQELGRRLGLQVSETAAQRAIAAEIDYYRAHLSEGRDQASLADLRRRCGEVVARELTHDLGRPVPADARMIESLLAALQFTRFADVVPGLEALRRLGLRLVVVSNWDVSLHSALARLGVAQLVDAVLTSAEAGARKPAPAIFEQALELAGVPAAAARHVGDSVEEDVSGARAAGIEPILIRRDGSGGPSGVITVSALTQLPELLLPPAE